jgi:glycolate oxidase
MSVHCAVPDSVVIPDSSEEVLKLVQFAYEEKIPITPRGAGTSVTGAILPIKGGIVLDMSGMNKIKEISRTDHFAVVEPGVICGKLNKALAPDYFFPPDPGSSAVATIGGMISTNASGLRAVKYGTTKDYVMALEVVLPTGKIIRVGRNVPKASAGIDLAHLFASAEGTLGVITEARLRIVPTPQKIAFCLADFSAIEEAGRAAAEILSSGIPLCACEIMDRISLDVVSKKMGLDMTGVDAMLIMEVDGHPAAVKDQLVGIESVCKKHGAMKIHASDDPAERGKIWLARQGLVAALSRYRPGHRLIPIAEDFGVPISKIPETITRAQALSKKYGVVIASFGHVGDGNLHTTFVLDPRNSSEWATLKNLARELNDIAFEAGGTVSAEHGIGLAKAPFVKREYGPAIEVMRGIKNLLDPAGIMNPGKLGLGDETVDILDYCAFAAPEKITSLGSQAADDETLLCTMCGFCRAVCPVFDSSGAESENARGKVQLAFALKSGLIEPNAELAEKFFACTGCGACKANCPSAIEVSKIIESVRGMLAEKGLAPQILAKSASNILGSGNPFGKPIAERFTAGGKTGGKKADEPLVFIGCTAAFADRDLESAFMAVLDAAGVAYSTLGKDEPCCGLPLLSIGDTKNFAEHAKKTADIVKKSGKKNLVTACAGCYMTFKKLYSEYVPGWKIKVLSISEHLEKLIKSSVLRPMKEVKLKVIYHDPCHLGRQMNVFDPPRDVIKSIPGITLLEFPENRANSFCCGGGGGLPASTPKTASYLAKRRIKQALDAGADAVIVSCPSCKAQLVKNISRVPEAKNRLKILDVVELVKMAID